VRRHKKSAQNRKKKKKKAREKVKNKGLCGDEKKNAILNL